MTLAYPGQEQPATGRKNSAGKYRNWERLGIGWWDSVKTMEGSYTRAHVCLFARFFSTNSTWHSQARLGENLDEAVFNAGLGERKSDQCKRGTNSICSILSLLWNKNLYLQEEGGQTLL